MFIDGIQLSDRMKRSLYWVFRMVWRCVGKIAVILPLFWESSLRRMEWNGMGSISRNREDPGMFFDESNNEESYMQMLRDTMLVFAEILPVGWTFIQDSTPAKRSRISRTGFARSLYVYRTGLRILQIWIPLKIYWAFLIGMFMRIKSNSTMKTLWRKLCCFVGNSRLSNPSQSCEFYVREV